MHNHSQAEIDVLASRHYGIYADLQVLATWGGSPYDVAAGPGPFPQNPGGLTQGTVNGYPLSDFTGYDPFLSARISADLDQPVQSAEFRVRLGSGTKNLSPLVSTGPRWPDSAIAGRPLLDAGQFVRLMVKCVEKGAAPGSALYNAIPWRPCFMGFVDAVDPAEEEGVLVIRCRDVFAVLLDLWIEPSPVTGGWLMPGLGIADWLPALRAIASGSFFNNTDTINDEWGPMTTVGSSTLFIQPGTVQPGPVLPLMRDYVLQSGWDLRGKWGSGSFGDDIFVLTNYEPNRALANPLTIGPSRYYGISGLSKSLTEVRSVVEVTPANPPRTPIKRYDPVSWTAYGRRYLGIGEDHTSQILDPIQAGALCDAILSDVSQPKIGGIVTRPLHPFIEINDVISLTANDVHHDADMILAISGYDHTLDASGHGESVIRTRDIPAAASKEWRQKQDPKMKYFLSGPPTGRAAEGAVAFWPD